MRRYVAGEALKNAIEYFRRTDYSKPEQIGLFFYFKAAGLNEYGYTTYKKWGDFDLDEREKYLRILYDLAGIFDASHEVGQKFTALFPFSITRGYRPNSFYNGGSVFKTLCSRISDTLDNALISTIIERDNSDKNGLKFNSNYLSYIDRNQLRGNRIPLKKFAAWCYRYWYIDIPEGVSEEAFTDILCLEFLLDYNISEHEFDSLFSIDQGTISFAQSMVSIEDFRGWLRFDSPECRPVIENGTMADYMPIYKGLSEDRCKELLEMRGAGLSHDTIRRLLHSRDEEMQQRIEWDSRSDIEKKILECWQKKAFEYVEVDPLYADFTKRFGKDAIKALSGADVLYTLFGKKESESLVYFLEHSKKYDYFGGVGGFRTIYTLYEKDGQWKSCTNAKNVSTISEADAIQIAIRNRDRFVEAFDCVENLLASGQLDSIEGYATLQEQLKKSLGDTLYNRNWVWKYLHMLYPSVFLNVFTSEWVNKVFRVAQIVPGKTYAIQCGQFSLFARKLGLENVYLYHILVALDDSEEIIGDAAEILDEEGTHMAEVMPKLNSRSRKNFPLNCILYGAPGTGKTYSTVEYALAIIEGRELDATQKNDAERRLAMEKYNNYISEGRIVFTTFHQSYGYEDFIQGIRPDMADGKFTFKPVDGIFKQIADRAMKDGENPYVIIIDEINRANISKVFGELISLIEEDKRWGELNAIIATLPSGQTFSVPNNLYIVGTMNSADKSISLIDTALRRRFEFIEVVPNYATIADPALRGVLERLNLGLVEELESTDLLIGHAYFIGKTINDLDTIMNRAIIPLLYEYFYDNVKKVKEQVKSAIDGLGFKIVENLVGRIRIAKESE